MAVFLILAVASCVSQSLVERLKDLVEYAENVEGIPDEEWESIKQDFYMTVDEFRVNLDTYTTEEKAEAYELIGKMNGIIAKREAGQAIGRFNEILESLPSMLDGFVEGITGGEN